MYAYSLFTVTMYTVYEVKHAMIVNTYTHCYMHIESYENTSFISQ